MREKVRMSYTDFLKRIAAVNRNVFVGSIPCEESPHLQLPLQMRKKGFPDLKHPPKLPVILRALLKSIRLLYFHFLLLPKFMRDEARASSKKLYLIALYYLNSRSVNLH